MYVTANGVQLRLSKSINNWLGSHSGPATVYGTGLNDVFYGNAGDSMFGGLGDDHYYVWAPSFRINERASEGIDTLYSYSWGVMILPENIENLFLLGGSSTIAAGNALGNIIGAGGVGAFLDGGHGDDVLVGGAGADTFQVSAGKGSDAIERFTSGSDLIRLQGYDVTGFSDLMSHGTQIGNDVKFTFSNGESLALRDVTLGSLQARDFALPIDTSVMRLSFADEFDSLTLRNEGGIWAPSYNFGAGSPENHGFVSETEAYVDPTYAGSGTRALGLNPFSLRDGVLSITAAPVTAADAPFLGGRAYTSGVLTTQGAYSQQYGYFEIRAALPVGQGFWPAFWLLPTNHAGGEIDIFESLGGDAGNLHFSSHDVTNGVKSVDTDSFRVFDPTKMHTYGVNWTATTLTFYVDGVAVATQDTPDILNKNGEMYAIVNLATGGWGGATTGATGTLQVDYIHIYATDDTVSRTVNGVQQMLDGGDLVTVTNEPQQLNFHGGGAGDALLGNGGDNFLYGYGGDDTLDGGTGANTLIGGLGNDIYVVNSPRDSVVEAAGEGIDTVRSTITYHLGDHVENLTLAGGEATSAFGNSLSNVLTGNAAANTLDGGAGADTLIGGSGRDTYLVDDAGDVVRESVGGGRDTVISSASYALAAGQEVEELRLAQTAGAVPVAMRTQNAGRLHSVVTTGDVTRFEVRAGDTMQGDDATRERSEIYSNPVLVANQSYEIKFDLMIEAGARNTADWLTLLQLQMSPDAGEITQSPPFSIGLKGDKLVIVSRASGAEISTAGNIATTVQFTDTADVVRGRWYDFTIRVTFDESGAGSLTVVRDGRVLVSYDGAIGYNDLVGAYLKEGIYREASAETLAANFKGLTVTAIGGAAAQDQSLTGNEFGNTLTGNGGNNILDGGAGVDTLIGGRGNDTYVIDDARDIVREATGGGRDTVQTTVSYSLAYGQDIEDLRASDPNGGTALTLSGNELANTITGNAGNNVIDGGTGKDTLIGGAGDDSYIVDTVGDLVIEARGGGRDAVIAKASYALAAGQEIETLQLAQGTGSSAFNLTGNEFANTLIGNAGKNVLDGGGGADVMIGGAGNDTYVVDAIGDVVKEYVGGGTDTVRTTISYALATGQDIEALKAYDLNGTAALTLSGNELNNTITGNAGTNILDGGAGNDKLYGGAGDDVFIVEYGDGVYEAIGGGDDTIVAKTSYGLWVGQEIETLQLAASTGTSALNLSGNELANTLIGNAGNNLLDGKAGADTLIGGLGNDIYIVDNAGDVVREAVDGGFDRIAATIDYTLGAGQEIERLDARDRAGTTTIALTGNEFANIVYGNAGANALSGGAGNDVLNAFAGDDLLIGGKGVDVMSGGAGNDVFRFASGEFGSAALGWDRVTDFARGDAIDLTGAAAMGDLQVGFSFIGNATFSGHAGEVNAFYKSGSTWVSIDADGDMVADAMIQLNGRITLTDAEFIF